jgi:hypothetical protein
MVAPATAVLLLPFWEEGTERHWDEDWDWIRTEVKRLERGWAESSGRNATRRGSMLVLLDARGGQTAALVQRFGVSFLYLHGHERLHGQEVLYGQASM